MHTLVTSLSATWQPFVLVAGLLLIGYAASREGLFEALGAWCARVRGGGVTLFVVMMLAVAVVSAVLNLDSSIVFMTPVAISAARAKGSDEKAFVFGTVFMANSASLLLIGSNLTNILVIANTSTSPAHFSARMALPWIIAVAVVIGVVLVWRWRPLTAPLTQGARDAATLRVGPGVVATAVAVVLMVVVRHPALEILAAGVLSQLWTLSRARGGSWKEALRVVNPGTLATLFVVAVAVGVLARHWRAPSHFMAHANVVVTTVVATLSALVINNLPAASLFAAHAVAHPYAMLLGLDVGPSCLITGALSSLLWRRIVERDGVKVSLRTFSMVGVIVTAVTIVFALPVLG
ncbi:MAG TPA: ArsB/NhaD family transporter [Acidimicrobiales bacterium]|nr:ArsB/NhaD family transporter [Acidimicrobiales bacterium]